MASIFTYSKMIRTVEGDETFTAGGCASFDEAKKFVDAGVRDRQLELKAKYPANGLMGSTAKIIVTPPANKDEQLGGGEAGDRTIPPNALNNEKKDPA